MSHNNSDSVVDKATIPPSPPEQETVE